MSTCTTVGTRRDPSSSTARIVRAGRLLVTFEPEDRCPELSIIERGARPLRCEGAAETPA